MKAIQPTFLAENRCWLSGTPKQEFYLYLELVGGQAPTDASRVPLNLALVVDRSGSMEGDKIAYAKRAAQFVVDNLTPDDCVAIVQYDNEIDVVSPAAPVQHKSQLRQRIETMAARGMTNLSGGLLAGYEQAEATRQDRFVNRVLLLSDGLANQGITDPAALQTIAQEKFRHAGIALSTFGIGADFNEVLLTNLSEYGGANYYFIDSPDKIPAIFAEELKGLLAVVAQNVKLDIRLPADYFRCEKVYGFPAEVTADSVRINFNDLFSAEKKAVLLKLTVVRQPDQDLAFPVTLHYDGVLGAYRHVEESQTLPLQLTRDAAAVQAAANPAVVEQTTLFVTTDLYEEVIRLAERRDYIAAHQLIEQLRVYLEKHFQNMPPSEELKRLYEEIRRYERHLPKLEHLSEHDNLMAAKLSRMSSYNLRRKKPGM